MFENLLGATNTHKKKVTVSNSEVDFTKFLDGYFQLDTVEQQEDFAKAINYLAIREGCYDEVKEISDDFRLSEKVTFDYILEFNSKYSFGLSTYSIPKGLYIQIMKTSLHHHPKEKETLLKNLTFKEINTEWVYII